MHVRLIKLCGSHDWLSKKSQKSVITKIKTKKKKKAQRPVCRSAEIFAQLRSPVTRKWKPLSNMTKWKGIWRHSGRFQTFGWTNLWKFWKKFGPFLIYSVQSTGLLHDCVSFFLFVWKVWGIVSKNNNNNNNNNELRTQLPVQHCGYMQHRVGCQRNKLFCKDICHFNAHKHEDRLHRQLVKHVAFEFSVYSFQRTNIPISIVYAFLQFPLFIFLHWIS